MLMTTLQSPKEVREKLSIPSDMKKRIFSHRRIIRNILDYKDSRLMIIVGPCSFHDPEACLEYAEKLKILADIVSERIFIILRIYFEKPRTCLGWKGYINDPYLNESYCMQDGIISVRKTMITIAEIGLPIASEVLNPVSYLYFHDLLSWCAVGARTTESQPHREIGSSLTIPCGFKNNISGDIDVAIRSIAFATSPQAFMGVNYEGNIDIIHAKGNPYAHLILRGSKYGGNYSRDDVANAERILSALNLPQNIIVDCSHDNSNKDYLKQENVFNDVIKQKLENNLSICGVILESFLEEGKQLVPSDVRQLKYGCSITDACINWEETQRIIKTAYKKLAHIKSLP